MFENIKNVFNIIQQIIKEHSEEIMNLRSLDYHSPSWTRSTLFNDNVSKWAKAKACVHADSVLCVGRMEHEPGAAKYCSYQDAVGLDGEAIEFEWKKIPRISTLTILQEIVKDLGKEHPTREFQGPDHLHFNVQRHFVEIR